MAREGPGTAGRLGIPHSGGPGGEGRLGGWGPEGRGPGEDEKCKQVVVYGLVLFLNELKRNLFSCSVSSFFLSDSVLCSKTHNSRERS